MCSPHPTPARGDPPGHSLVSPPLRRQSSLDSRQLQSLGSPGELGSPHVPSRPSPPCTGTLGGQRYQLSGPRVQDRNLPSPSSLYQLSSVTMGWAPCLVLGMERQVRCSPSSETMICQVMTAWHHQCQDSGSL